MLAQLTADQMEIVEALIGQWSPLLGLILPIVFGLAMRYDVLGKVKRGVSVIGSIVVAVIMLLAEDWTQLSVEVVMARIVLFSAYVQFAYAVFDALVATITPRDLNGWLAPNLNLVPGLKTDPDRTLALREMPYAG